MTKTVIVDANIADLFYTLNITKNNIPEDFQFRIGGTAKHELMKCQDHNKKGFFNNFIQDYEEYMIFNFAHHCENPTPLFAGFNFGAFASLEMTRYLQIAQERYNCSLGSLPKRKNSAYAKNESDIMIGSYSFNFPVITRDKKTGPLTLAKEMGGKIMFITQDFQDKNAFFEYLRQELNKL